MTILVDMDDVLEDLLEAWLQWINERHGTHASLDDVHEWNIAKVFPGLKHDEVYAPLTDDNFWQTVKPREGAAETLQKLIDEGHEVYVVTNSHYQALQSKMENVLFKYYPFITWDHVIITAHKQMVIGDVLIDDGVHNLEGGTYAKILMDAPHNRGVDESKYGALRAHNWNDVYQYIHTNRRTPHGIRY